MAYVQSNTGYNTGPITLTGITVGSTLVAYIQGDSSMASTSLPAPWSKRTVQQNGAGVFGCLWVYDNHPGGSLSSAITSPPGDCGWSIQEHSGRDNPALESEATTSGTGTAWTSSAVTATLGADVVFGCGQESAAHTITYTAPSTRRTLQSTHVHATGDQSNVSAGSITGTGAIGPSSVPWVACAVSLKASAGGPAATAPPTHRRSQALTFR